MSVTSAYSDLGLDVTRAPLRSADPDLGGSELNLARTSGGLRTTSRRSMRLGPPPAAGYATAENSSATLLQRAWTESHQRWIVFSRDRRPPIRRSVRCYSPAQIGASALAVGQLLDPVRVRTLVVGVGAPGLSIVEL